MGEKGHNQGLLGAVGDGPGEGWLDAEGYHLHCRMKSPTARTLEELTQEYRRQIRNSEIWDYMVKHYGREKAEEMLKGFRVELR
jgi:hypothetical protein